MPKKAKKKQRGPIRCPYCGAVMDLKPGALIFNDPTCQKNLLACRNYPTCNTYVRLRLGTHEPLGTPANGDLRNLRNQTHRCFDTLWRSGKMSRDAAYRWMADFLGLKLQDTHIGMFGTYQCHTVIRKCRELTEAQENEKHAEWRNKS